MEDAMNRSERRRLDRVIKEVDNPVKYELSLHQIEKIKQDAVDEAVKIVEKNLIRVMFALPILVAHWEFGFGPKRCERFAERICEEYEDKFKRQGMKPEEFAKAVGELTGIRIE